VKAGLASVMVRQRQPLDALRLFAAAEQGGPLSLGALADRGLAYDLIGDNDRAQRDYYIVLAAGADAVVSRRLALSQAMAGDLAGAEKTLLPLLQKQDLAAYRTRAFALAIGGRGDEAVQIAQTMLPPALSGRISPYLRYMPRLTRAQQAAAADLGAFPAAGEIGRDDPALAAYAASIASGQPVRTADARLVPSGAPMGSGGGGVPRREPAPVAAPPPQAAVSRPAPVPTPAPSVRAAALPERARVMLERNPGLAPSAPSPRPVVVAAATPPVPPAPAPAADASALARVAAEQAASPAARAPPPAPPPVVVALESSSPQPATLSPEARARPVVVASLEPAIERPAAEPRIAEPAPEATSEAPAARSRPASLDDAFADLRAATSAPGPVASGNAVDITRIQPRREQTIPSKPPAPAKPPAPPKPPPAPSRQWVQVGTGRDIKALAFDWRRLQRENGALLAKQSPATAKWGQTNRLVIGPFASADAADAMIDKLKAKKIDAFRFTSSVGEEVKPLG
jgi:hypothetical protein